MAGKSLYFLSEISYLRYDDEMFHIFQIRK